MTVERYVWLSRRRDCPACGAPSVMLPVFTTRRRSPVTCTDCGTKLERVLPGLAYYSLSFITGMLAEAGALAVLLLGWMKEWVWIAVVVSSLVLINLAVSALLNWKTRVEFFDIKDARKDQPGRWYPEDPA